MASKIGILRAVAAAVGARPPTDENEATAFLRAARPVWDSVVADFTTRHAWTWGTTTRKITASTDEPPAPWTYSYPLPVDRTLIRDVTDESGSKIDYDIEGQRVVADAPGPLFVKINISESPGFWPGDFAKCVQITLEGYVWKGLRDDFQRGQKLIEDVDPPRGLGRLARCIARDKRQRPARKALNGSVYSAFKNTLSPRRRRDG